MKILMSMLITAMWICCTDPEKQPATSIIQPESKEYGEIDSLIPPYKKDNIRFLQQTGGKLVYKQSWSGPLIAATFHNASNGELLKTVPVRDLNPYLSIGYSIQHYDGEEQNNGIFLYSKEAPKKNRIKAFLPQYLYDEIPDDSEFSRGITMCRLGSEWAKSDQYIPVYYLMEWEPRDEREFMGDYGVTMMTILDSMGREIYRHQFDGILTDS